MSTSSGNSPSVLTVLEWIQVEGTLQAGSAEVTSKSMTVSGKIDVSGGGYLTNQGPGNELVFMIDRYRKSQYWLTKDINYFYYRITYMRTYIVNDMFIINLRKSRPLFYKIYAIAFKNVRLVDNFNNSF